MASTTNPNTYLVGLSVSLFGGECLNSATNAGSTAGTAASWLPSLTGSYSGCDSLGADTRSKAADV